MTRRLDPGRVHLWRIDLDRFTAGLPRWLGLLDSAEQARAARLHSEQGRSHFIVSHAALRLILASYSGQPAAALRFEFNAYGKPALPGGPHFNLSASGGLALLAVCASFPVGVDVEAVHALRDAPALARRFFSPSEAQSVLALQGKAQQTAFFNCWARKEAYIKARGMGLSLSLSSFSVECRPGQPARLLSVDPGQRLEDWSLLALEPGAGYAGALAVNGPTPELLEQEEVEQLLKAEQDQ